MTSPLLPVEDRALRLIGLGLVRGAATLTRLRVGLDVTEDTAVETLRVLRTQRLISALGDTWEVTPRGRLHLAGHPLPRTPQRSAPAGVAA